MSDFDDFDGIFDAEDDDLATVTPIRRPVVDDAMGLDEREDLDDFSSSEDETAESFLRSAIDLVERARGLPMSATVMVSKDDLLDLLDAAVAALPDELRRARWLLRDQEAIIADGQRKVAEIIEQGSAQVQQMASKEQVVRQAKLQAATVLEEANEEARRRRHEVDDYCDQKLAKMQIVLERIQKTVTAARDHLQPVVEAGQVPLGDDVAANASGFFDQDLA